MSKSVIRQNISTPGNSDVHQSQCKHQCQSRFQSDWEYFNTWKQWRTSKSIPTSMSKSVPVRLRIFTHLETVTYIKVNANINVKVSSSQTEHISTPGNSDIHLSQCQHQCQSRFQSDWAYFNTWKQWHASKSMPTSMSKSVPVRLRIFQHLETVTYI